MMEGRSDEFILSELWDTVICLDDADHHERGGYTVNLQSGTLTMKMTYKLQKTVHLLSAMISL